ncbi:MAG: adenine-specific DNA-methyltransferase [Vallitaleaceae bacterium]|nr:adenine-specific DNA-methyltransferase [Vallitaleaceae bacterium]
MIHLFNDLTFQNSAANDSLLICEDALIVLSKMKDNSVDLIFADPPYNIGKDFGNDSDKWLNQDAYLKWCYCWIDACFRVLKDTGTFYLMNATQNMSYLDVYIQAHYHIINHIVWTYDSSGMQSKTKFGSLYEPILMTNKSAKSSYTFNDSAILVEAPTGAQRNLIDYRKTPPAPYNHQKIPGNVWQFPRVRYRMNEYENPPSQKPEALLERIILASSNEGDVVLDPFSGTFSTAAVAKRLGRKVIGIEVNPEFYKIGLRRVNDIEVFNGETLIKEKVRKTKNKSKNDHLTQ